jgi:hypothetical protein
MYIFVKIDYTIIIRQLNRSPKMRYDIDVNTVSTPAIEIIKSSMAELSNEINAITIKTPYEKIKDLSLEYDGYERVLVRLVKTELTKSNKYDA